MKRRRVWLSCRRLSMFYTAEDSLTNSALTPRCSRGSWAILSGKLGKVWLYAFQLGEFRGHGWYGIIAIRNAYKALHSITCLSSYWKLASLIFLAETGEFCSLISSWKWNGYFSPLCLNKSCHLSWAHLGKFNFQLKFQPILTSTATNAYGGYYLN